MRKFKSGDKVKLVETGFGVAASEYLQHDSTYTVNSYDSYGYMYLDDPVPYVQFKESDFELVEEESMSKFKSGDKVRLSNNGLLLTHNSSMYLAHGEVYTVLKTDERGYITLYENITNSFNQYDFELVEEASMSKLIDKQDHYKANGVEPIELMKQNFTKEEYSGFLQGNIIKYLLRFKRKNGVEDLKKALTYLTWLIEQEEK